jgi:glutamine synthetase
MVGSRDSVAAPNVVLNTIVAEAFRDACDELEAAGPEGFDNCVHDLIKRYAAEHQRIVFNGNGYSESWVTEAKRRGLPNLPSMVDAIPALTSERAVRLFGDFGVFTPKELTSRMEIKYETYSKDINIEARTMLEMFTKLLQPAMFKGARQLSDSVNSLKQAGIDTSVQLEILEELGELIREASSARKELISAMKNAEDCIGGRAQAASYRDNVVPAMEKLRKPVDRAEMLIDKELWPVPTYADLMFEI